MGREHSSDPPLASDVIRATFSRQWPVVGRHRCCGDVHHGRPIDDQRFIAATQVCTEARDQVAILLTTLRSRPGWKARRAARYVNCDPAVISTSPFRGSGVRTFGVPA